LEPFLLSLNIEIEQTGADYAEQPHHREYRRAPEPDTNDPPPHSAGSFRLDGATTMTQERAQWNRSIPDQGRADGCKALAPKVTNRSHIIHKIAGEEHIR
jgi:hypothetical protein